MSKILSFTDHYKINKDKFDKTGAFDPIMGIDTKLFIDPSLISKCDIYEFSNADEKIQNYFIDVIRLIESSTRKGDIFWKNASKSLVFPEIKGLCIGYSNGSVSGRGLGPKKRDEILITINDLLIASIKDPLIFQLISIFEDDVGADLISDMTSNILHTNFIEYTQNICFQFGIKLEEFKLGNDFGYHDLPKNPNNNSPIILVPKSILRDLPVAESFTDISWVCDQNQKLRKNLSKIFTNAFGKYKTSEIKRKLKNLIKTDPETIIEIINEYKITNKEPYDSKEDPNGVLNWYENGKHFVAEYSKEFIDSNKYKRNDEFAIVAEICYFYKYLIEHNKLSYLLYNEDGSPRIESAAQYLFFGVATAYCNSNNLDISPESDAGRGPVDFKFSNGRSCKVLVEVKLTSNKNLVKGYHNQLEIYKLAERATRGFYLVVDVGGITASRFSEFKELIKNQEKDKVIIYVDGKPKPSASKANQIDFLE